MHIKIIFVFSDFVIKEVLWNAKLYEIYDFYSTWHNVYFEMKTQILVDHVIEEMPYRKTSMSMIDSHVVSSTVIIRFYMWWLYTVTAMNERKYSLIIDLYSLFDMSLTYSSYWINQYFNRCMRYNPAKIYLCHELEIWCTSIIDYLSPWLNNFCKHSRMHSFYILINDVANFSMQRRKKIS